jgi:hypothetical protein
MVSGHGMQLCTGTRGVISSSGVVDLLLAPKLSSQVIDFILHMSHLQHVEKS